MNFLNNIPQVTKNLLILNILFYVATLIMANKGVDLISLLGAHNVLSPLFKPYQLVTHFFMHSFSISHIFMNMFILVMLGSFLEKLWGPKRFFIFYVVSAIGAFALYNGIQIYQIFELKQKLVAAGYDLDVFQSFITDNKAFTYNISDQWMINQYLDKMISPMVGASGAVFGILAAFAYLFPNTEFMLLFFPFPIKAKYLVGGYVAMEIYLGIKEIQGDNIAHFAHVGGAIAGIIMVLIWKKQRNQFY